MSAPPAYVAQDVWMALGLPVEEFQAYYDRNHWANTWASLLAEVRRLAGRKICWQILDFGERCVLTEGHAGPHCGPSDVGTIEPLPPLEDSAGLRPDA